MLHTGAPGFQQQINETFIYWQPMHPQGFLSNLGSSCGWCSGARSDEVGNTGAALHKEVTYELISALAIVEYYRA
ncbi:MAG TPA: hypothetical protein VF598_12755 [Hymenobacter sp.]